jgi:hypothetical protein
VFLFLQPPLERKEHTHVPQCHQWIFIKQALCLSDEICDICRVLIVVFVPSAIQELPVVLDCHASHKNNHVPALDQMLRQGLVVVRSRFDAENMLRQAVLNLDAFYTSIQLFEPFNRVIKDQVLQKRLALCRAEERTVLLFRNINPDNQMLP